MNAEEAFEMGAKYLEKKDLHNALVAFKQALRIEPDLARGHNGLAVTYALMKDYTRALLACCEAIRLDPKDPEYFRTRGYIYDHMGDDAAADADLAKAEELEAS